MKTLKLDETKQLSVSDSTNGQTLNPIQTNFPPVIEGVQKVADFLEFTMWNALPTYKREPKTQKDFAKKIGVGEDTLSIWKNNPKFWDIVWQFIVLRAKDEVADVMDAFLEKAKSAKTTSRDLEMVLRIAGTKINKTETKKDD